MRGLLSIPWFEIESWSVPVPLVGEVTVHAFGILVVIAVVATARVAERRAAASGVSQGAVSDLILHIVPPALVMAYFLNPVLYQPHVLAEVFRNPEQLLQRYLGLSSYGGFLGGAAGALFWRFRRGMSLAAVGDPVAFALPLGWFFGRTGCFLVHDHPGRVSDFALAVENYRLEGVARHDLGLYEALWSIFAFATFLVLGRKRRRRGFYLALLPLLYAPMRFFLDFLRATAEVPGGDARYFGLTPGQYGSLVLLVAGLALARHAQSQPVIEGESHGGA